MTIIVVDNLVVVNLGNVVGFLDVSVVAVVAVTVVDNGIRWALNDWLFVVSVTIRVNFLELHNLALHAKAKVLANTEVHAGHDLALERLVHAALVSEEIKIGATESVDRVLLGRSLVLTITVCSVIEHVHVEVENFSAKATIR